MARKAAVYICAHQDDIYSTSGTLMLLRKKGYEIHDWCMTLGQKGGKLPNLVEVRKKEEAAACEIIGAKLRFFDQMDGELYAGRELCETVADGLKEVDPEVVITMWPFEKPDHAAAYGIAHKAMYLANLRWTSEFYMVAADGPQYKTEPDLYVNVTPVIEECRKVAKCYPSQWGGRTDEWDCGDKKAYGRRSWVDYAEAFNVSLPMVNKRWDRKAEVGRVLLDL
jgi:LmbE family N-acetylglucosaminyl deacetylase